VTHQELRYSVKNTVGERSQAGTVNYEEKHPSLGVITEGGSQYRHKDSGVLLGNRKAFKNNDKLI